jgi:hypothetical protein
MQDAKPQDPKPPHIDQQIIPVQHVLAINDSNFPDIEDWIMNEASTVQTIPSVTIGHHSDKELGDSAQHVPNDSEVTADQSEVHEDGTEALTMVEISSDCIDPIPTMKTSAKRAPPDSPTGVPILINTQNLAVLPTRTHILP